MEVVDIVKRFVAVFQLPKSVFDAAENGPFKAWDWRRGVQVTNIIRRNIGSDGSRSGRHASAEAQDFKPPSTIPGSTQSSVESYLLWAFGESTYEALNRFLNAPRHSHTDPLVAHSISI